MKGAFLLMETKQTMENVDDRKIKNQYIFVYWGRDKDFPTYASAWKQAKEVIIPQLLNDPNLKIFGSPKIIEGKKAGTLIVQYQC